MSYQDKDELANDGEVDCTICLGFTGEVDPKCGKCGGSGKIVWRVPETESDPNKVECTKCFGNDPRGCTKCGGTGFVSWRQ